MIVPSSGVKVLIAMKPVDFRKGMDGLAAVVHETLGANPCNPPGRAAVKRRRASGGRTSSSRVGVCRAGSAASRRSWKECRRAKPADRCR